MIRKIEKLKPKQFKQKIIFLTTDEQNFSYLFSDDDDDDDDDDDEDFDGDGLTDDGTLLLCIKMKFCKHTKRL